LPNAGVKLSVQPRLYGSTVRRWDFYIEEFFHHQFLTRDKFNAQKAIRGLEIKLHCCHTTECLENLTSLSCTAVVPRRVFYVLTRSPNVMDNPIPTSPQEIVALRQHPIDEELVAAAIAGVVRVTRSQGKSLEELTAEVLHDDAVLEREARLWLSHLVAQAWNDIPD
jgi:hypothetical protein